MNNPKQDLPNATTILVLGILSLVFCWCYGIIGLILGIITVVMAANQKKIIWLPRMRIRKARIKM